MPTGTPARASISIARNRCAGPLARGDALVFGPETAGLPQALLDAHADRALRIPMRPGAVRSLNLSTAVGVVAYAALARLGFPDLT